jgi:hypothetical protein
MMIMRVPVITCQLQFTGEFGFDEARVLIPYLDLLGGWWRRKVDGIAQQQNVNRLRPAQDVLSGPYYKVLAISGLPGVGAKKPLGLLQGGVRGG